MSKQRNSQQTVASCEAVLVDLEEKIQRHRERAEELVAARNSASYAARVLLDVEQSKVLSDIVDETVRHETEGRALIDALDEAKRRLEAARQNEALSADRAAAREVRKELSAFREHGQSLDVALAAIALHGRELQATLIRMHQLGVNFPSGAQLDALGGRALMAACSQTPWRRRFDAVPPRERYRFAELVEGWAATVERGIAQRLGEQKDNTDAAA